MSWGHAGRDMLRQSIAGPSGEAWCQPAMHLQIWELGDNEGHCCACAQAMQRNMSRKARGLLRGSCGQQGSTSSQEYHSASSNPACPVQQCSTASRRRVPVNKRVAHSHPAPLIPTP